MTNQNSLPYSCSFTFSDTKLFEGLSDEELDLIAQNSVEVNYRKGEQIFKQGTFATHMGIITSGLAKIYMEGDTP